MDKKGALTLLGFAQKSGKLAAGESAVEVLMKKGKVKLLLLAEDQPDKGQQKWCRLAEEQGIEAIVFATKEELGQAIGLSPRSIVGIRDEQMAKAILQKITLS